MKQHSPAAERNKGPILDVLRRVLPARGAVLEIASGSGEHAVHFARGLPGLTWQPSDVAAIARESVAERRAEAGLENLLEPIAVDVTAPRWDEGPGVPRSLVAVVCINMIHIAPWPACEGLVAGAARLLAPGAALVLYGPFSFGGLFTAPSNEAFDASLRDTNAAWGVRDVDVVTALAAESGFAREALLDMPANNHTVVLRAGAGARAS